MQGTWKPPLLLSFCLLPLKIIAEISKCLELYSNNSSVEMLKTLCNSHTTSLVCGRVRQSLLRRRLGALSREPRFVSYWAKWLDFQRYLNSLFSFLCSPSSYLFIHFDLGWGGRGWGVGGWLFLLHWHELRAGKHQTRHVEASHPPCSTTTTADEDTQQTGGRTGGSLSRSKSTQPIST